MRERQFADIEVPIFGRTLRFHLDLSSKTQKLIHDEYQEGILYEAATVIALSKFLEAGDLLVDLGAHVGFHSLVAAAMTGASGKVLAFEPNLSSYKSLINHVQINGLSNVSAYNMAVGAFDGAATLYENSDNDGEHALWPLNRAISPIGPAEDHQSATQVRQVTLDSAIRQLGVSRIDIVKMDVEGAEVKVMEGARRCLENGAAKLIIAEFNPFALAQMGNSASEFIRIFYDFGYRGYWSKDGGTFNEITFRAGTFEPYGEWFEYHCKFLFNLFFVSQTRETILGLEVAEQ